MKLNRPSLAILIGVLSWHFPCVAQEASGGAERSDYLLQPADLLRVQIFQEDDLTREVRISQEYTISLPLVGSIELRGRTLADAQRIIRDLYDRDYLVNPQVNVIVLEYAKRTVNVIGSVNSPGAVPFPQEEGLTLLDAITRAGGFNRFADRRRVRLTRTDAQGATVNYTINADDIIQGNAKETWPLQRDDVIFVPERLL
ncbi:MAG: polysaccharide export protein [Opitutaceae bacterium]|nr:polysaccharide export protein [Opitutaceae bacterium]